MEKGEKKAKNRFSTKIKIQAIKDLESGEYTVGEVMEKFGVKYSKTLKNWGAQYSKTPEKYKGSKTQTSKTTRLLAVKEILSGFLSVEEAAIKYDMMPYTIGVWVRRLSSEINQDELELIQNEEIVVENPMTTDEKNRIKELEKALKVKQLQVLGLETMIDIAERTYKLDIRKKFGSKQ